MSSVLKFLALTSLLALMTAMQAVTLVEGRDLMEPNLDLAVRLKLEADYSNCWESLIQLQSCTGEVIQFFLNGKARLGFACCRATRIIQRDCWPALLGSLGFTTIEGDILESYCDKVALLPPSTLPSPPSDEPSHVINV